MEIEYEVTVEDFVEFFQTDAYVRQHEHPFRIPYVFTSLILVILIFLYANIVISPANNKESLSGMVLFIISITFFVLFPSIIKKALRLSVKNIYAASNETGKRNLKMTETWLVDKTSTSEFDVQWIAVEKIVETDVHLFIYVNPMKAILIPKRAFSDEAKCSEFIETAKKYHADADAREK